MSRTLRITLDPGEIAAFRTVGDHKAVFLPATIAAYGMASGMKYLPGGQRLDAKDRRGRLLAYWTDFPVNTQTTFLGPVPTPENVYGLEAAVRFEVEKPETVAQWLLADGAERLTMEEFGEQLGRRMQAMLGRLACRLSPEALVGGPAMVQGEHELQSEISRVYDLEGFTVHQLCLQDVSQELRRHELEQLVDRIEADAGARGVPPEDAFERSRTVVAEVARSGDAQARALAGKLASFPSYQELKAAAPREQVQSVVSAEAPRAVTLTEPVLLGGKHEAGGRFAVLSRDEPPRYFEILRPWFFVGRDENCHVSLPRGVVSSLHATIARPGSGLAVVDHNSVNRTFFNGERIAQRFVETGDVLRIGDYWLVFKLEPGQEFREIDRSCRGAIASSGRTVPAAKHAFDDTDEKMPEEAAMVRLMSSAGRWATSDARPILIGHDSTCDLRLGGGGVARFHAVVYWDVVLDASGKITDGGVFLEDLHSGRGTLRNGHAIRGTKLENGDTVEAGGQRITVTLQGNTRSRAEALHAAEPSTRGLTVTCIEGPGAGGTVRLDPKTKRVLLGRDDGCDLTLPSEEVSGKHAEVVAEMVECEDGAYRPEFVVTDPGSTNGTLLNGGALKPNAPRKIRAGDLIRLSTGKDHCDLLVHHNL